MAPLLVRHSIEIPLSLEMKHCMANAIYPHCGYSGDLYTLLVTKIPTCVRAVPMACELEIKGSEQIADLQ